jgi:tripartite-type tricarboxylate transporter receptor subunit TctC
MKRREFILLFAGAMATRPFVVYGQPDHPITLIVPYAPGGGNDVLARAVAEPMAK